MQEFEYTRCYKMAKKINADYLPKMSDAYNAYIEQAKRVINNQEPLNNARSITDHAEKLVRKGYSGSEGSNERVSNYLDNLKAFNERIKGKSGDLNNILDENQRWFKTRTSKIMEKNNQILKDIKKSDKPASELEVELKSLALDIQKLIEVELAGKMNEIVSFLKSLEAAVVNEIEEISHNIHKCDSAVMGGRKSLKWNEFGTSFVYGRAAFYDKDYTLN